MQQARNTHTRMGSEAGDPGDGEGGGRDVPAQAIQLLLVLGEQELGVVHDLLQIG